MSMNKPIAALSYADRFVRALPADPLDVNRTRQVMKACYSRVQPTAVPKPELADVLAGNRVLPGMRPYAACYGGHQFGSWAGQLGDGRAITLGEVVNERGDLRHHGEQLGLRHRRRLHARVA